MFNVDDLILVEQVRAKDGSVKIVAPGHLALLKNDHKFVNPLKSQI